MSWRLAVGAHGKRRRPTPFCNVWHEITEGSDHVTRWVKSSFDGRMVRESDEV